MRYLLAMLLAMPLLAAEVTLTWDYDPVERLDVEAWRLYHSTNLVPTSNFVFHSDYPMEATNIVLDIIPGQHWFFLTASNWWTESEPSNVVRTPNVVTNPVIHITR